LRQSLLSQVHIYHHFINNTFRVVGRKLQDHEVGSVEEMAIFTLVYVRW
jgi:hypothetical protein